MALVLTIAQEYGDARVHVLDLIHAGNDALLNPIKAFADSGSDDFPAFATPFVENAIVHVANS
ncbi:MAG TPA: hypothetical protein VFW44_10980 [Bryobacteraceae bacterium]|nr:hypothetical protein [Bryobacteraceae bacterium]